MSRRVLAGTAAVALLALTAPASAAGLDELVAAAKAEGQLTTVALPHDWCGYGALLDGFKAKYGITINELNPDAGSGDEDLLGHKRTSNFKTCSGYLRLTGP